jgi:hypothetical protein
MGQRHERHSCDQVGDYLAKVANGERYCDTRTWRSGTGGLPPTSTGAAKKWVEGTNIPRPIFLIQEEFLLNPRTSRKSPVVSHFGFGPAVPSGARNQPRLSGCNALVPIKSGIDADAGQQVGRWKFETGSTNVFR